MAAMAQLATKVLGATSSRRCNACSSENPQEATYCRVCGAIVGGVTCSHCDAVSPRDTHHCEFCGHSFPTAAALGENLCESVAPPQPAPVQAEGPSPAALIGFGAVLALAAASSLLAVEWQLFPGIPLALIALAGIASAAVALVRSLATVQPGIAVLSGLVALLGAIWLDGGFAGAAAASQPATLATIGAIVVMTAGLHARRLPVMRAG